MKKVFSMLLALLLVLGLAACGDKKPDGVYTARADEEHVLANNGWVDILVVTYEKGVVVDAVFECYNAEGQKKSELGYEEYPISYSPSEWIPLISQRIVQAGTAETMDVVAGATNSSETARLLFEAIEAEGKPGETIIVTIPPDLSCEVCAGGY